MKAGEPEEINKRMVNMQILKILQRYTDDDHSLTQQEILHKLRDEYGTVCDRRTVRNNIGFLGEMGYEIEQGEEGYRLLTREFEDSELRLLIDSVLFSKTISEKQARVLISKLEKLGSAYFEAKVTHVHNLPELQHTDNRQVLYSVGVINDAIDDQKKIQFTYNRYDTDMQMHRAKRNPRQVTPYQMVANNGRYYVLCYEEFYKKICYYRLDRMTDVTCMDEAGKRLQEIPGMENGLDLPRHMAEHFYMFGGESVPITIRARRTLMGDLIDWFGKDILILNKTPEWVRVRVRCNEDSVFFWALQYGQGAEILKPESLRKKIRKTLADMTERYAQDP